MAVMAMGEAGMRRVPRFSFPCYDKYHRCPGWNGPRLKYHREGREWCVGGYVTTDQDDPHWRWKLHRCNTCGVLVLPCHIRHLDPVDWWSNLRAWWLNRR